MRIAALATLSALVVSGSFAAQESPQEREAEAAGSACVSCHEQLEDDLLEPLRSWNLDVHRAAGLGCEGCHGGDPSPRLADDAAASMAAASGFRGAPDRFETATFCGNCHADAEFMKHFDPSARIDQLAEYRTSLHGRRNAAGDPVPATCTDCHGVHGVREIDSPASPVFAANVPGTCARCHADPSIMEPYGIATTQYEDYLAGAHAAALIDRGDMAAPACNDCHGNHGAAPPGLDSVANVCGQCHGREAQLFRASIKKDLFEALGVAECTTCHANHRTRHPTSEMFHSGSAPSVSTGTVSGVDPFAARLGDLEPGERVDATWAVATDPHVESGVAGRHEIALTADGVPALVLDAAIGPGGVAGTRRSESPHFDALLTIEPVAGEPFTHGDALRYRLTLAARDAPLRSVELRDRPGPGQVPVAGSVCLQCHEPGDECDRATARMYEAVSAVRRDLREAEALLRRAEVAGMDVGKEKFELESAGVTAAVEARALIHSFDPDRLVERAKQGREVARSALEAGHAALAELQFRRKGLAVSLVLVALVLVGLYLKIRQIGPGPPAPD